ncbi:hypothetical protein C8A01DRAFT_34095 [Parachaetomium inaequale]|uniref:Vacuolar sorting protein Vps3844 C-terminal domain-containing protein n=1 Tax=Parachaetomium inaequale TaxID=2588326 RepID=A0AAN6PIY0_9PEZI|nr:hypothetical protein C8A01DRAFT_34095 [Parachaetomium inaequale]
MRLVAGLTAAALSGLAAAANQQSAEVYLLQSSWQSSPETPSIPKEVARHIFLQRTSRQRYGSDLRDIPGSIDTQTAVDHLATFGKTPTPLFTHADKTDASQLVVILEGTAAEQSSRLKEKLGQNAAFTISDPPSATANKHLMTLFRNLGVASSQQCELSAMINPFEADCWAGPSSVVKYDLRASPETLDALFDNLSRLDKFVADGDLEVLLVLLPESSRSSKLNHWSAAAAGAAADLRRRRDAEMVISDQDNTTPKATPPAKKPAASSGSGSAAHRAKPIPQCFPSLKSCMADTNSCSGHGECVNKYGGGGGNSSDSASAPASSCFACVCKATVVSPPEKGRKTKHWGGNMCQKEDISVQFWLIAGFTVTIVGAVTFAIYLLFGVGEETLPGVIGAGVSRSK